MTETAIIAFLMIGFQAYMAVKANPVDALKYSEVNRLGQLSSDSAQRLWCNIQIRCYVIEWNAVCDLRLF